MRNEFHCIDGKISWLHGFKGLTNLELVYQCTPLISLDKTIKGKVMDLGKINKESDLINIRC